VPRPFPTQTVRDLIGIARLLYRTWDGHGVQRDPRLPELVAIGKDLTEALSMAKHARGPKQLNAAWEKAERATRTLSFMLDAYVGVRPLIESTFNLVDQSAEPSEREAKRKARQRR
jgi:hypothetical protein